MKIKNQKSKIKNFSIVFFISLIIPFVLCHSQPSDPDGWDIAALDVARNVSYLSDIEKDVLLEMNKARTNPAKYAQLYIKPMLQYYNGKEFRVPGATTVVTNEGKAVVSNCISEMSKTKALPIFTPEQGLSLAARDHAADLGKTGKTGHKGSDRSSVPDRINRYGKEGNPWGENISYGKNNARDIVLQLLVDDGVKSRGHRKNILSADFSQAGISFATHTKLSYLCVIDFSNNYITSQH